MATFATALSEELTQAIQQTATKVSEPKLVLVCASPKHPLEGVMRAARDRFPHAALLGASSSGEFNEARDAKGAISIGALDADVRVFTGFGTGLKGDPERAVAQALEGLPREVAGYAHCTAILLLDALSGVGEEAALLVAAELGPAVQLAGGAAGDDLAMTRTLVASGDQVAEDALALALVYTKEPLGVGVSHGHVPVTEPMTVTDAHGGQVRAIDGRPPWDVWRERTRHVAKARGIDVDAIPKEDVGAFLLRFEAGLALSSEADTGYKIRAPLAVGEGGALSFACGIPTGAVIRITESVPERQVASAIQAAQAARAAVAGKEVAGAMIFDCICRNLILGDAFATAVTGMSKALGDAPIAGFETYGEIALNAGDFSGFHNTTTVVLVFPATL